LNVDRGEGRGERGENEEEDEDEDEDGCFESGVGSGSSFLGGVGRSLVVPGRALRKK
jgi:hypothetical protein